MQFGFRRSHGAAEVVDDLGVRRRKSGPVLDVEGNFVGFGIADRLGWVDGWAC